MEIKINETKSIYILHKVSQVDLALSIRHMAVMLESGLALEDTLEVLGKQSPNALLKNAYTDILKEVRSGKTTSSAMRKHPKIFSEVIVASPPLLSLTSASTLSIYQKNL